MIFSLFSLFLLLVAPLLFLIRPRRKVEHPKVFGFFHPYCSGGGGGERVLWKMIQNLQSMGKECVIYTIDSVDTNEAELRKDAARRFDVEIEHPVKLISLEAYRNYLLPSPFLSLVLESWGTMKLAREALKRHQPDVFCDTTGCAFTFLVARWMVPTAWILAYVHYPTISTDMMQWEWKNTDRPKWKSLIKLIYYWIFAILYGLVGSLADLAMVNSTWTYGHIHSLWRFSPSVEIVYPPCRVENEAVVVGTRQPSIVSIGQFRPEKDHKLQITAVAKLVEEHPELKAKLVLIGSCRNQEDEARVDELRALIKSLDVEHVVEFHINPPYSQLLESLHSSWVGIHTMRQEHFGIGVVEMMAAGLITIAHNSGGPKTDIVEHGETGFLAITVDEYSSAMYQALTMEETEADEMRHKAQTSALRFSDEVFDESLKKTMEMFI